MFEYWSVNERVLMGHLRGMCENVGQAEQLYRSLVVEGGNYQQKQKQKILLHACSLTSIRLTYEG